MEGGVLWRADVVERSCAVARGEDINIDPPGIFTCFYNHVTTPIARRLCLQQVSFTVDPQLTSS